MKNTELETMALYLYIQKRIDTYYILIIFSFNKFKGESVKVEKIHLQVQQKKCYIAVFWNARMHKHHTLKRIRGQSERHEGGGLTAIQRVHYNKSSNAMFIHTKICTCSLGYVCTIRNGQTRLLFSSDSKQLPLLLE